MPIRQGKAKLWFNTKEQQDEYDDKMIASVQIQSPNYEDENFTPIFSRKRQQFYLELSDQAKSQINRFQITNLSDYIDKYHIGKRDHTFWRAWTIQKFGFAYAGSYLILRELPIRNFYARAWIMLFFLGRAITTSCWFGKHLYLAQDQWNFKQIKNYGVFNTFLHHTPPTLDGKLPEQTLWKMNQPGYLRSTPHMFIDTAFGALLTPRQKVVQWDGTFNMPLQGLASPKHKDAKWIDFIYQ